MAQPVAINQPAIRFEVPEILQKAGVRSVRCIFRDSRGLMWFGTENGLYRFDGTHVVYKRKNAGAQNSFPDNTIVNIAEDSAGNLWIGTLRGAAKMNPYNFECVEYSDVNKLLPGEYDVKVHIDKAGKIWAGHSKGLAVFNPSQNRFIEVLNKKLQPSSDTYVTCIADYNDSTLAVGTFKGVRFFHKNNYTSALVMLRDDERTESPVTALFTDSRKKLWAGTWGYGFLWYDTVQRRFVMPLKGEKDKAVPAVVGGIAETFTQSGSDLWIAGSGDMVRLPFSNGQTKPGAISIYRSNGKDGGFPVQSAGHLSTDANGTIWMAGEKDTAVVKFNPSAPFFNTLPVSLKGTVYDVQSFQLKNKRYYCISSWYNQTGMTITDENWKVIRQFARIPINAASEAARNVSGIAVDKFDRVWVSTLEGVTVLNNFQVIKHWSAKTNAIIIHNDMVWVAVYKKGIDIYDLDFKKLHHYDETSGNGLKEGLIWKFFCDNANNLWLCANNLLYKFNGDRFTPYTLSPDKSGLGCMPRDIAQLPDNALLVASDNGLIHLNAQTGAYKYIRPPLLQNEDKVTSVSVDANGNAWYLTAEHLVFYEPQRGQFTLFGSEDGLRSAKGMQIVRVFNNDEVIIGQDEQLLQFSYRNSVSHTAVPKLMITSLQVNDSNWLFSKPLRSLQLQHFQNKLYIEFTGINYEKAAQNQYAVWLEGIDKDWVITNRDFASYANLGPGNYRFKVKVGNYAGNWSDEYVINIHILPPFWRTWWFISIAVLILGSIFFLVVRYISQRNLRERILLLEKEQAVEKERTRIASDMHDDLGSGLTKIAILSEVAKKQLAEPEKAVRQLENISSSSRELVDNLQDIIWVLNPRNDSLDNLAAYIREYALKFFEPMNVQLSFEYPANIPAVKLSEEVRRNIFLVMKETFNNIAKHAQGRNIQVKLAADKSNIEIVVCDDGKGFETSHVPAFSNGLNNMNSRMKQIGGLYEFDSQPGKGTKTRLVVTA
jgi:signal transduction histidine kinase/ligand-binding sensor domain-containing protein